MGGEVSRGDAVQSVFDKIGPMNTSHHVSNVRVNLVPGESTATVTAYSMSQHFRAGEGKGGEKGFLVGGRYAVDVTRDERDGVWKMTKLGCRSAKKWVCFGYGLRHGSNFSSLGFCLRSEIHRCLLLYVSTLR